MSKSTITSSSARNSRNKRTSSQVISNPRAAAEALEVLFASGYIDKKRLYFENFIRGMFFSVGSLVGAAIIVTILLWILSLFNDVPFIRTISDNIEQTLSR